jgi:hypothetical protein
LHLERLEQKRDRCVLLSGFIYELKPTSLRHLTVSAAGLTTRARVVFIGACQMTNIFTDWWNLNLSGNGTKALVVPDLAAMINAPQNSGITDYVGKEIWEIENSAGNAES